jgi:hypothetical protein
MNHTTNLAIAAIAVALAILMVAATPLVSTQALAYRHYHHHHHHHHLLANNNNPSSTHRVVIGNTQTAAVQAADNSQHCAIGAGATVATCSNTPINNQSQTTNSGSTGAG